VTRRRAVVFGEVVVDLYPDDEVVAGSALHLAAHLAHLGWTAYLITRLGRDDRGDRALSLLEAHGVDTSFVETDPVLPTGLVTVDTSGEENRFDIHRPAAWDAIEGPRLLPEHEVFSYGTLATRSEPTRAALQRLREASPARHRVLDVNLRPPDVSAAMVGAALRAATAAKLSEEELASASALLDLDATPDSLLRSFPSLQWLCVTRGRRGAELHDRFGLAARLEPPPTRVTNTIGAGDAFAAGLIDGLARGLQPDEVLAAGQRCASKTLARRGGLPDPPTRRH
jgi:fructokinase